IPERPESEASYERPPRTEFRYVPDVARHLEDEELKAKKAAKKAKKAKADSGKAKSGKSDKK
ncbi:MAG: polyphosphate kinase 2, partial [Corynebacterium sp.]|nr:polyphosphate kinase 2 [Corynebacterium sp.]